MQNQACNLSMRGDMQGSRGSEACSEHDYREISRGVLERVECRERRRSQSRESRGSSAATEPRIIHSPNLHRPVIPHFGFERDPAIRAIGVAVETQHINLGLPALLRQPGSGCPNFQFAALEWYWFSNRRTGINAVGRRKQNQPVRKWGQGNHSKIQNRNHKDEFPPNQRLPFTSFHVLLESFFVK